MHHNSNISSRFEIVVLNLLKLIIRRLDNMALELDALMEAVRADIEADRSAIALIHGIADEISKAVADAVANAQMDPAAQAKIDALAAEIKASSEALAAAIVANTPADPEAPPVEEPAPVEPPVEPVVDPGNPSQAPGGEEPQVNPLKG